MIVVGSAYLVSTLYEVCRTKSTDVRSPLRLEDFL